jgi:RimJ/RimL family protein N-acetyltransferase/predicted enzyme related to lactoylglutathione lyase
MDLDQVTLPTADLERAVAFYRALGLVQIVSSPPDYARFECPAGNATLSLHLEPDLATGPGAVVYFECEDLDERCERLRNAGIEFDSPPTDERWLWREARLRDPDGNRLCLFRAGGNRRFPPWRVRASAAPLPRLADGVVLRRLAASDLQAFQAYRLDPEAGRYQGWSPMTDAEAGAFLLEMSTVDLFRPGLWSQIGIAESGGAALIGDIGLFLAGDGRHAEIGFTLGRAAQGRGLGSRAVRAAVALAFEQAGVERVLGITDARNLKSIRLLQRIGMRLAEVRGAVFRGESCIEHVYAISRHDAG